VHIQSAGVPDKTKKRREKDFLYLSLFWSWDPLPLLPLDIKTPGFLVFGFWDLHQQPPGFTGLQLRIARHTISF
jgi:hypothetical protein